MLNEKTFLEAHFLSSQMCPDIHVFAPYKCSKAAGFVSIHKHKSYHHRANKSSKFLDMHGNFLHSIYQYKLFGGR